MTWRVAPAAARKDVLSSFFGLLSLLCYLGYVRSTSHRAYVGTVVTLALALMAKPTAVVLPFLLLVLDAWPLQRLSSRSQVWDRVREKLPLFALIAASAAVTVVAQQSGGAVRSLESLALGPRVENALVSTVAYVGKVLWPRGLAVYYPHPQGSLPLWKALAAAAGLALVTFLVLRAGRRRPYLAVGWLWFGLGLAPVIGLVQVGQAAMADRYTYLPLVGLSVMAAWGARDLVGARGEADAVHSEGADRDQPGPLVRRQGPRVARRVPRQVRIKVNRFRRPLVLLGPARWSSSAAKTGRCELGQETRSQGASRA